MSATTFRRLATGCTWSALALIVAAVCLPPTPAAGKTPLEQEWARYNEWQVADFRLEGVPEDLQGELKKGLALAGKSRFLRGPILPEFRTRLLLEDIARIRLFLARRGFPSAAVSARPWPETDSQKIGITLLVEPGPRITVRSIELVGWPDSCPLPEPKAKELLQSGDRFQDARMESSRQYLRRFLRDRTFARAEVEASVVPSDSAGVEVKFTAAAGASYTITSIKVSGASDDLLGLARRLMNIHPPAPYSQKRIEEAAFDLRGTQLFRQVALTTEVAGPGELSLNAELENARMRSLEASIGTWADNPWRIRTGWNHRDLLGGGRGFDAQAAVAKHTQSVGGGLTWFGWLSPRARTRAGAQWIREDEDAYLSREWGLDLTFSLRPRGRDLAHFGMSVSRVFTKPYSSQDLLVVDREGNLLELWADRKWDWSDEPLFPRQGGFGKLSAVFSPPIGFSESPYLAAQGDLSLYRPLGEAAVLAGHVRAGLARPLGGSTSLIPNRRFFAGGYSTMRGYGRRQLGPRDDEGVARGGEALLVAGLELRLPIIWILDLTPFIDTGQVWGKPGDLRLRDLETAVGIDLDFRSPLGPVRFGYAWNLGSTSQGPSDGMAHFGVGYPW